ncbi:uncharacterized protein LOC134719694 [Mytilus trossulus]|uniref:uncharacterized protein LOC134719694 n=1 Tax=Mytilus trossulus TaxID=6551 RepID=UPI0030051632
MASLNNKKVGVAACIKSDSTHCTKRSRSDSETDTLSLSDDSTENVKKQRPSKKGSDSDDSIAEEIRTSASASGENVSEHAESSDSSQISVLTRMDTESPIFLETIKKNTSEWTDLVLPNFRIIFGSDKFAQADDVFTKGILHLIEKEACSEVLNFFLKGRTEDKEKYECFRHAVLNVFDIDCCHIDNIQEDVMLKLNQIIEEGHWIDNYIAMANCNQPLVRRICDRDLCTNLKTFIWQLLYMIRKRKGNKPKELSEGMYQELFVSFARIFGLNIVSGSNVEKYSLTIDEKDFVAIPDAVICHPTAIGDDKIFAVIEVKKCCQDEENEQIRNLRSIQKRAFVQHVGSSLKGQHCGQFLCTLPFSAFGNRGMYGFIVQGTQVTLTSFKPEDGYYENLCNGYLRKKEAVVTCSKEYNILKKDDRKQLVETFLDFEKLLKFICIKK